MKSPFKKKRPFDSIAEESISAIQKILSEKDFETARNIIYQNGRDMPKDEAHNIGEIIIKAVEEKTGIDLSNMRLTTDDFKESLTEGVQKSSAVILIFLPIIIIIFLQFNQNFFCATFINILI